MATAAEHVYKHKTYKPRTPGASPVVTEIKSLERAHKVDVPPEAADPVVSQSQVLELRQRF